MKQCRFDTIAVHGIYSMQEALDFNQGSLIEPVYLSTSQAYRDADEMEAALSYQIPTWCYSRIANPSLYYYEGVLALLEGYGTGYDTSCCATSSGMAALNSACEPFLTFAHNNKKRKTCGEQSVAVSQRCVEPVEMSNCRTMNFVATCQVYGGTFQQFAVRKEKECNIEWRKIINSNNISEWESKIDENTCFLFGEMPSNPGQAFFDLEKVAELAKKHGIPMIVDSTVATPALLRPIQWGADIVIQSVSKTITSSGFGIAGAVIAKNNLSHLKINNDKLKANFCRYLKTLPNRDNGPNLSPMNAIMTLNDIRTLRSKVDLLSRNTMKIARFLEQHKHIEQVDYLGLEKHPLHKIAKKYMVLVDSEFDELYGKKINRYGHLMSFRVKGGAKAARNVFDAFQRIWRATDLGKIKSVATIPAISTHQQQGEQARKIAGIPPNLIRLCVGAEHPDDIIADIEQALGVLDGKKVKVSSPEYSAGGASSAALRK
ncbi:MAG: O-acetylhomoserine aminocarboxypropyltransferase/cysteine synthase [Bacteroidia bacterium]|nr:O-acetylhomoserine aminocarboxypropyltransferase/cysteine synthase [Bacteroidia bacterium]